MKINIDTSKFTKFYTRASGLYNKIIIVLAVIVIIGLIYYLINPPEQQVELQTDNIATVGEFLNCPQTGDDYLEQVTISNINLVSQISLINYKTEVLEAQNQKNIIPPITKPVFMSYETLGSCFGDFQKVITVTVNNITKIYPVAILEYHIVINDIIDKTPIIVVYTPISGIIKAFNSSLRSETAVFGHSGSIYKNTDLLVDFKTDSLWSVFNGKALVGISTGAILPEVEFRVMNYGKAKTEYPEAQVMSFITGFRRNYGVDPFVEFKNNNIYFQEPFNKSNLVRGKEIILGFEYNGIHYAVPTEKVSDNETYNSTAEGQDVKVEYTDGEYIAYMGADQETKLKLEIMYWYIWYDYYPDTRVI